MDKNAFVLQLDGLLAQHQDLVSRSQYDDLSDLPDSGRQALVSRAVAAIHRISGARSSYSLELERLLRTLPPLHVHTEPVLGVVQALRDDIKNNHLESVELVQAETFSDLLDMAEHLSATGYKDVAAVIAGSALEVHLRALCGKLGLSLNSQKADGTLRHKKADAVNTELCQANAYSKLDQKNVTAWLDLRNKAAHGKYSEYQAEQVKLLIAGIRDFIARHPA